MFQTKVVEKIKTRFLYSITVTKATHTVSMLVAFSIPTMVTRARLDITLICTLPVVLYFKSPDLSFFSEFLCCPFANTVTGVFPRIINGYLHSRGQG
jgi:hypothetical protein